MARTTDRAMEEANATTVVDDFAGASLDHFGVVSRFERRGDRFVVNTEGPDGALHDYEVAYTFGFEPLQQYLVRFPDGRMQDLSVAWDARPSERRWTALVRSEWRRARSAERRDALDPAVAQLERAVRRVPLDQSAEGLRPRRETATPRPGPRSTSSAKRGHGPGSRPRRVGGCRGARREGLDPRELRLEHGSTPAMRRSGSSTTVPRSRIACRRAANTWSSRRAHRVTRVARRWRESRLPGEPLLDTHRPSLLRSRVSMKPDGQIRDEVYDYASFLQGRMYAAGVTCSDCHDSHSTKVRAAGDALCGLCHRPTAYATQTHHYHEEASRARAASPVTWRRAPTWGWTCATITRSACRDPTCRCRSERRTPCKTIVTKRSPTRSGRPLWSRAGSRPAQRAAAFRRGAACQAIGAPMPRRSFSPLRLMRSSRRSCGRARSPSSTRTSEPRSMPRAAPCPTRIRWCVSPPSRRPSAPNLRRDSRRCFRCSAIRPRGAHRRRAGTRRRVARRVARRRSQQARRRARRVPGCPAPERRSARIARESRLARDASR